MMTVSGYMKCFLKIHNLTYNKDAKINFNDTQFV